MYQAPPKAQQERNPEFELMAHLGHGAIVVIVVVSVLAVAVVTAGIAVPAVVGSILQAAKPSVHV